MGVQTLVYYFGTTFMAIIVGVILVVTIHPGERDLKDELAVSNVDSRVSSLDAFLDLFRSVNIVYVVKQLCVINVGRKHSLCATWSSRFRMCHQSKSHTLCI